MPTSQRTPSAPRHSLRGCFQTRLLHIGIEKNTEAYPFHSSLSSCELRASGRQRQISTSFCRHVQLFWQGELAQAATTIPLNLIQILFLQI